MLETLFVQAASENISVRFPINSLPIETLPTEFPNMVAVNVNNGQPTPVEFLSDKHIMDILSPHTASLQSSVISSRSVGAMSPMAQQGMLVPQDGILSSSDPQGTATAMLQATPFLQQAASGFRIGQPKTLSNISHPPISLSKITSLTTTKHFADLRRQQGKLAREGAIRLIGHFFIALNGKEMNAPQQV